MRSTPGHHEAPSCNGGASVWDIEILDGVDAFSDEDIGSGEYGDESSCAGLQSQTGDAHHGDQSPYRSDTGLMGALLPLIGDARRFTRIFGDRLICLADKSAP